MNTIYLAGGCFWGMQRFLDQFDGVLRTEVGYANGPDRAPSYEEVCRDSGHAETVRIDYDPAVLSLTRLLAYYFLVIDPLSVNRQGGDSGIQYRTGIYYTDEGQLPEIRAVYEAEEKKAGAKLAVELEPLRNFFPAEEYHQKYLEKNPGGYCHIPARLLCLTGKRGGGMTIEAYILAQEAAVQPVLRAVCAAIRGSVGEAEECISWQMPTWRRGRNLIHFAAQKKHVGIYPGPEAVEAFLPELDEKGYQHSKGAIRMPYDRVDEALIGRIAAWCGRHNGV